MIEDHMKMNVVKQSSAEEYLLSFWTREKRKPGGELPLPEKMLETILGEYPYKFPGEGKTELTWHICEISSVQELEQLWMHKCGDWLEKTGIVIFADLKT